MTKKGLVKGPEITDAMVQAGLAAFHYGMGELAPVLANEDDLVTAIYQAMVAAESAVRKSHSCSRCARR